jgi:hypothetical protein
MVSRVLCSPSGYEYAIALLALNFAAEVSAQHITPHNRNDTSQMGMPVEAVYMFPGILAFSAVMCFCAGILQYRNRVANQNDNTQLLLDDVPVPEIRTNIASPR